jgi:transcriptional regulator with XRE-family HTH domain
MLIEKQFVDIVEERMGVEGWSRSELARQIGCSPQMVTNYLNGRIKPGPDVIERFFTALKISPRLEFDPVAAQPSESAPPAPTPPRRRKSA